ncbi:MAG: ROK family protein [Brevundimonas sp.]|uniref:ROK family protein n=1 Tax=Brevundimonas sp. TaxID=1871086 RepID=UPI0040333749
MSDPHPVFVGIETGGAKILCRVVAADGAVLADVRLPTEGPETAQAVLVRTVEEATPAGARVAGIGLASFGPLVIDPTSADYGVMLATPKPRWSGFNLGRRLADALDAPVAIDTDVNVAALAEQAIGAARGLHTVAYVTVGTGIGGGMAINGLTLKGALHPEIGHVRVRRAENDRTPSRCVFHPDCAEGLSAGPALGDRLNGRRLEDAAEVRALAADYLGQFCATLLLAWSPQRIVLGGGVMGTKGLIPEIESRMRQELNGYGASVVAGEGGYLVPAALENAGLEGALIMAREIAGA